MGTATRRMLGEILVDMGCVTPEDVKGALHSQMGGDQRKLGDILIEKELVSAEDITNALSEQYGFPVVDIDSLDVPRDVLGRVPENLARQHNILPIEMSGGKLTVAIADPLDMFKLEELRFVLSCDVDPVLASAEGIQQAITRYYGVPEETIDRMYEQITTEGDDVELLRDGEEEVGDEASHEDAPVVRLVTLIIVNAVRSRASDIHVEPMINRLRIRYRVDGVCYEVDSPPKRLQGPIIARIKIMAQMDMAEKRRPQDGRIKMNLLGHDLDLRVSTLPGVHGESVVMRLLDKASVLYGLEELGLHPDDNAIFRTLIRKPNGIILITGPTGSGKTTTLYAALQEINQPDRKIITAEEPVEYNIMGINQCEVRPKAGLTFSRILRAMLRQAPNVILVGEIRDLETAEIAIQAALTGHLVFSTLHTNDAPSAISRLIDIGIKPFLAASSIQAVMAQRLVRTLCPACKEPGEVDPVLLRAVGLRDQEFQGKTFYQPKGCPECRGAGFRGRIGIFEMMVMNNRLREMAFHKTPTDELRKQAVRDGMRSLFEDGLRKVMAGSTTLDEILQAAKIVRE